MGLRPRPDRAAREPRTAPVSGSNSTTSLRAGVAMAVDRLVLRIEELETENDRLTAENRSLWATVHAHEDAESERVRKTG